YRQRPAPVASVAADFGVDLGRPIARGAPIGTGRRRGGIHVPHVLARGAPATGLPDSRRAAEADGLDVGHAVGSRALAHVEVAAVGLGDARGAVLADLGLATGTALRGVGVDAARSASRPTTGSGLALLRLPNTGPKPM